jgi:uncharacterized protein with GYD domain
MGGRLESMYYAFGETDLFVTLDAPDDGTVTALAVAVNSSGAFSGRTTKLLTPDEVDKAIQRPVDYRPPGS